LAVKVEAAAVVLVVAPVNWAVQVSYTVAD
jgi:hypothetical protein